MAHPYNHARSSVNRWGGVVEDYLPIHNWFDGTKAYFGDCRHRALRHHTAGIFDAEREFGVTIVNSDGRVVPVRAIGEQHVTEDCGFIPSVGDWLVNMKIVSWMNNPVRLSRVLGDEDGSTRDANGGGVESTQCSVGQS